MENIKLNIKKKYKYNISNMIKLHKNENIIKYEPPNFINIYELINKILIKFYKYLFILFILFIIIYLFF